MSFDELYDELIERGIASEETLRVVTDINGNTVETLNDVLYAVTGYRSLEQMMDEEV